MKKTIFLLAVSVLVAGCAKRPDAIMPTMLPAETYTSLKCKDLNSTLAAEKTTLATLSASQNSAANADALGVFLVGVPLASLTDGDKAGLISVSKGKIQALESARLRKGC